MKPELIDNVPADVTAQIVPKTLFGEKYISLIPADEDTGGRSLRAGDTIRGAVVPIEFEKVLNDFYPLLTAVEPENLATTLSALSTTFEGRGEDFGNSLVTINNYLKKFNPESQAAVDDIIKLGQLSDSYADDMPTFGRLLKNSAFSSRTVVDKRTELAAFFDESRRLSDELTVLFRASGGDMVAVAAQSVAPLGVAEKNPLDAPVLLQGLRPADRRATRQRLPWTDAAHRPRDGLTPADGLRDRRRARPAESFLVNTRSSRSSR